MRKPSDLFRRWPVWAAVWAGLLLAPGCSRVSSGTLVAVDQAVTVPPTRGARSRAGP